MNFKKQILDCIIKVERWVENHNYKGYEPFDGLSSYLRKLTFGNLFFERILQQFIRQSPINLRPLLGVKPQESTKGRGYMAWGYLTMFKLTRNRQYRKKAVKCLEWLIKNKSPNYSQYSWGNHFDFSSRIGELPKFEPIVVWSSLIGQVFLDAYEILDENRYLEIASNICDWIINLPREKTDSGTCLSYVAFCQRSIHNSNMLGAALLARTARFTGNREALKVAKEAMEYSCTRQLPNGAWYYGEEPKFHWIDNFHTGYNLDSLKCYIDNTNNNTYRNSLINGFKYFKQTFFGANGRPKYYHDRVYPIDIQCASQAIDTLTNFSDYDESSMELALKVAKWTIKNLQDDEGYFYFRVQPLIKIRTPMLHWGQATMYKALTVLLSKI